MTGLLSVPAEIRLRIYQYILASPVYWYVTCHDSNKPRDCGECKGGEPEEPGYYRDCEASKLSYYLPRGITYRIPWVNLLLTCRTITYELQSELMAKSNDSDDFNTNTCTQLSHDGGQLEQYTYVARMVQGVPIDDSGLGDLAWLKLPCRPEQVDFLQVNLSLNWHFRAGGCGGPSGATRNLYRTLRHLIQCGPALDRARLLPGTMRLKVLHVNVTLADPGQRFHFSPSGKWENDSSPDQDRLQSACSAVVKELLGIINMLARDTTVLHSFIRKVVVSSEGLPSKTEIAWQHESSALVKEGCHGTVSECDLVCSNYNKYGFVWCFGRHHEQNIR